ncbi:MAG: enoyl-CoA hydratase-related protein [Pseudomonadales bacterium]
MKEPLDINIDPRGVCQLTLNRPQRGNALDGSLVQQLSAALAHIRSDPVIRVVILTGQGASFCSGADLQWMQRMAEADFATNESDAFELALLLEDFAQLPLPTVARVNGPAYGGANGLISACDVAIACDSAVFTFSEVRLGLVPVVIAPYVVTAMGLRQARRWLLSAEAMDSAEAVRLGLVHQVVADSNLDEAVEKQVQLLLKGGPNAQAKLKAILNEWQKAAPFEKEDLAGLLAEIRTSCEGQEGLKAFLEKRKPRWPT